MNEMTNEEKIKVLQRIADSDDSMSFYTYSGRGMYDKECVAIDTDYPNALIEQAASRGVMGARVDRMGRGYVVYWPSIQVTETEKD